MSFFVTAIVVTAVSVGYSVHQAKKARKAAERARREAEARADAAKGFQFVVEGQAASIPVTYGRNKVGGIRVHFKVASTYIYAAPAFGGVYFESRKVSEVISTNVWKLVNSNPITWGGTWSLEASSISEFSTTPGWIVTKDDLLDWKAPTREYVEGTVIYAPPSIDFVFIPFRTGSNQFIKPSASLVELGFAFPDIEGTEEVLNQTVSGGKNEFLFVQQAVCQAGVHAVYEVNVDDRPISYTEYNYGQRHHIYKDGSVIDPMMTANDLSRSQSRFTDVCYMTSVFRLNRDEAQYNGTPNTQLFIEGNKVFSVIKQNNNYGISSSKIYSNNPALVLLDYLLDTNYGKGVNINDIDLQSFYKASRICGKIVKSNVPLKGSLNIKKGMTKDVYLYECNLTLDSSKSSRENITKIIDTMNSASLVWSEGKYKLNLPYALLYSPTTTYTADDIVQLTVDGRNRLFRATTTVTGQSPLQNTLAWVEDVIPEDIRNITDNDIIRDGQVLITWPDSSTKLNFVTVKYLNEEQDFVQDTVSWPEKSPTNPADTVYNTFLSEDNNLALESEVFADGCTTPYHAKARAEQLVRLSRETIVFTFELSATAFILEPGDVFGFSSELYKIPYSLLKVDNIQGKQGGIVSVTASTFDARLFAWNVGDETYTPLPDSFEGNLIGQAKELQISIGSTDDKTSNYRLSWNRSSDNRVVRYIIKYTTDTIAALSPLTVWTEIGSTSSNVFDLPALNGTFTFAVIAQSAEGKNAPYRNIAQGSSWPLVRAELSSAFLNGFSALQAVLSNDTHSISTLPDGTYSENAYENSGTEIQIYQGSNPLVYDGLGLSVGTWKITVETETNIEAGTIIQKPGDITSAIVGDHSALSAENAKITYKLEGITLSNIPFILYKSQTFVRVSTGENVELPYIALTNTVISKQSPTAAESGEYSSVVATGKLADGSIISNYGYLKVTYFKEGLSPEVIQTSNSIEIQPVANSKITSIKIELFQDPSYVTLLDTEVIPIVYKGNKGSPAINVYLSNPTKNVSSDADGTVLSYINTGTEITVFEGGTKLEYNGVGTSVSTWKVVATPTNITTGAITDGGEKAIVADHSNLTSDNGSILYVITGKTSENVEFTAQATQTFIKARKGETSIDAFVLPFDHVFVTDLAGTISSYTGAGARLEVYEGSTKLTFDGVGANAGTTNGKWTVTAAGTNITPATRSTFTVVNGTDANIPVPSNMTADVASIVYTITGVTSFGKSFTLTRQQNFSKRKQGLPGTKSVTVNLYKWAATAPPSPLGSTQFLWNTLVHNTYVAPSPDDGWSSTIPANPGTPLFQLWTAEKRIESPLDGTTTNITSTEWSTSSVRSVSQNGANGLQAATATVYKWSVTIPSSPVGSSTYTWSSGTFDVTPDGWSKTIPAQILGNTLWAASVSLNASSTQTTSTVTWTTASIGPVGYAGTNGLNTISVILDNENTSVPTDSAGNNGNYNGTAFSIRVFEGTTTLTPTAVASDTNMTNGTWRREGNAVATNITIGTGTIDSTNKVLNYGNSSDMTADSATIVQGIRVKFLDGTLGSFSATQKLTKVKSAVTPVSYYLDTTPVAIKQSLSGVFTPDKVTAKLYSIVGNASPVLYSGRFRISTSTNGTTFTAQYTSSSDENTKEYTIPANTVAIKVESFIAGGTSTLIDEEVISVVLDGPKGDNGTSGIYVEIQNESHTIPTDSSGQNGVYTNSGFKIKAYEGTTELTPVATATLDTNMTNGTYKIGNIEKTGTLTIGAITVDTTNKVISSANHADLGSDLVTLTIPVTIKTLNGTLINSFRKIQTITIAKAGVTPATPNTYSIVNSPTVVRLTNAGGFVPASITTSLYKAIGDNTPALYAGRFIIATSSDNGSTYTNQYTSTSNESSKAFTIPANTNLIRIRAYFEGGTSVILDEETIPVLVDGSQGFRGNSYSVCYAKLSSSLEIVTSNTIVKTGTAVPTSTESNNSWGRSLTWSTVPPALANDERLWLSDGIYNPVTNETTWNPPYWASLKVASLSAINANLGTITAGKLQSSDNNFVIDLTNKTIKISV